MYYESMRTIKIREAWAVPGQGGFYFDDQAAVISGDVRKDGFRYVGTPRTAGFHAVRQVAECVSIVLILDDGQVAVGDCVSVQYSGVGGREPLMNAHHMANTLTKEVLPALKGRTFLSFRESADLIDDLVMDRPNLGSAAAYGLTQATLHATALASRRTMANVIQDEWDLERGFSRIPIYAQSGELRELNVDKMIMRTADALPHGLINNRGLVGPDGKVFASYIEWVSDRVLALRTSSDYHPVLHFDVYGLLGSEFGIGNDALVDYLVSLEDKAAPFALRIEHPFDAGSRDEQITALAELRGSLRDRGSSVQLVADEWANNLEDIREFVKAKAVDMIQVKTPDLGGLQHSIEAVLECRRGGVAAHVGGSCTETDVAARASVHIALACHADQLLAKPGMGVDEGFSTVTNEMNRVIAMAGRMPPLPRPILAATEFPT